MGTKIEVRHAAGNGFEGTFQVVLVRRFWFPKVLEQFSIFAYGREKALSNALESKKFWEKIYE